MPEIDKIILGLKNYRQLRSHIKIIKKKTSNKFFEKALRINYSNSSVLNPSLWK